jgi:hypothetical protein
VALRPGVFGGGRQLTAAFAAPDRAHRVDDVVHGGAVEVGQRLRFGWSAPLGERAPARRAREQLAPAANLGVFPRFWLELARDLRVRVRYLMLSLESHDRRFPMLRELRRFVPFRSGVAGAWAMSSFLNHVSPE